MKYDTYINIHSYTLHAGIKRDKTKADKLMYIPNNDIKIIPFINYNWWF